MEEGVYYNAIDPFCLHQISAEEIDCSQFNMKGGEKTDWTRKNAILDGCSSLRYKWDGLDGLGWIYGWGEV